jgi:hypothetical protein
MKIIWVLAILLMAGCATPESQPNTPPRYVPSSAMPSSVESRYMLSEDLEWSITMGRGILKNRMTYTLLAGEYVAYAENSDGIYFRHIEKGIRRKNMGFTEHNAGGLFVPSHSETEWGIWIVPSGGIMFNVGGAPVVVGKSSNKDLSVTYLDPLPEEHSVRILDLWLKMDE